MVFDPLEMYSKLSSGKSCIIQNSQLIGPFISYVYQVTLIMKTLVTESLGLTDEL